MTRKKKNLMRSRQRPHSYKYNDIISAKRKQWNNKDTALLNNNKQKS
jgi:hypothetical protein